MAKTEDEMARRPWGGALVSETETGEKQIIPLTRKESQALIREGEIDCNAHEESPNCFCRPFISLKDENIWIHRRI
jgi:hypothetical protein